MTNYLKITGFLVLALFFSSCNIKDGLDECPDGKVRINLYVEKFQNKSDNPLDDREDKFFDRVGHLRYYLYRNGSMAREGIIDDLSATPGNCYGFDFDDLEYGSYNLLIVANCTKTALSGDPISGDNLVLTYPGSMETEDFFSAVFPFSVENDKFREYEVGLMRTHGVIRYSFKNMPANVSEFEVMMENISNEKWITGDYKNSCRSTRRYQLPLQGGLRQMEEEYMIATFPTLPDTRSAYHLSLYERERSEPLIQYMVTDTLNIRRNQLIDIEVTFNDGGISFEIDLDPEWGGSSSGGEIGIQ